MINSTIKAAHAGWVPAGDDGIIATRGWDVLTSHTPLVGQYSEAGLLIHGQVMHSPGPMLYWLIALPAHLGSVTSIAVTMGVVNTLAIIGCVALARRRGGLILMFATAAGIALMCQSLPAEAMHDIWNPAAGLFPFLLLIFLSWSLTCGEYRLLPFTVFVASFIAGDGFSAIAVSGMQYTASGLNYREGAYVIYGGCHPRNVDLQDLGTRGFRIDTQGGSSAVAAVGDVNGDGRSDLMLSAGDPSHYEDFVLFGRRYEGTISPGRAGASGFAITGLNGYGFSFAGVGDINEDHRADVLAVRNLLGSTGGAEVDLVYGSRSTSTVNLTHLGARGARILTGPAPAGSDLQLWGFTGLGDLNGDGRTDFVISSETWPMSSGGDFLQGTVSILYGAQYTSPLSLANLGSAGYQLTGPLPSTNSGIATTGNELGFGVAALNGFAENGRPLFAVGAPGLGLPGTQPGSLPLGEVLLETPPSS